MTASGDGTAHIWKYVVLSHVLGGASSEESPDSESEDTDAALGKRESRSAVANTIKAPIIALTGHQGVVSGCEWLNDELCVTSSWDRYVGLISLISLHVALVVSLGISNVSPLGSNGQL